MAAPTSAASRPAAGPPSEPVLPRLTPTPTDQARRDGLRRMKAVATGALVAAAVVYAVTVGRDGALGFVNAAAEAAMVGALADWFAVTAIFRRPLGLPVPHTALIPTRKDALGRSLEEFVATNFLAVDVVQDKIARAEVSRRVGGWLQDPAHADRVTGEMATLARGALRVLRDDDVVAVLEQVVLPRLAQVQWSPVAGRLLSGVVAERTHHRLVDLLLDEASRWLAANEYLVVHLVTDQAPAWSPSWLDERVGRRVYAEIVRWVREVRADEGHSARRALDNLLARLADDLQKDPETMARAEALKDRFLANSELRTATTALWATLRQVLVDAVDDEDGALRRRVSSGLVELGGRLATDPVLQQRVDAYILEAAGHMVRSYAGEVAAVISETVQRWDADDASRRIELHVGRDLQFIRINGTVVGALAGLAIHAVTVALS